MKSITKKQFRLLIIAQFVLLLSSLTISLFSDSLLSSEAALHYNYFINAPLATPFLVLGFLMLPIGLWALQNMVALYQFKSYAPKHLLIITVLGLVIGLAIDPIGIYPMFNFEYMIDYVLAAIEGIVLALVYTSNVANFFETENSVS